MFEWLWIVLVLAVGCVILLSGGLLLRLFRPWYRAAAAGKQVPFPALLAMHLRGYPVSLLVDAAIELKRAGADASIDELARCYHRHKDAISSAADLADRIRSEESGGSS